MRNSWYKFNAVELSVGWLAGTGAWFGFLFFLAKVVGEWGAGFHWTHVMLVVSAGVISGHAAAMRFHQWGLTFYLWSVALLLFLYVVSGWFQSEFPGVVFWLHTGVLPLHLLLFGLPKARHLLAHEGSDWDVVPEHREERRPPSFLLLLTTLPAGAGLYWLTLTCCLLAQLNR